MRYVSTRGMAPPLEFGNVLVRGLAPDGGLYVPSSWPTFSLADFVDRHGSGAGYSELASEVMWPFVDGSIDRDVFDAIVVDAYATFDHADVVPIVELGEGHHLAELFHGPTLAFKDVALQLVGRLFDHELSERQERVTIVVATSGDTGSAAIAACRDRPAIDIVVLHPHNRTSPLQRRQMTTVVAPNVHNVAIEGTFDDCQDLVKAMFADEDFRAEVSLSAMNSINWARVMAQIVYYFWAAMRLDRVGEPLSFTVPTGNFGNVFAGYAARRMGLDVAQFVVASNRNDVLPQFFATGELAQRSVEPSLSPSMDIAVSSNLERLLFELSGRNGVAVAELLHRYRSDGAGGIDAYQLGVLRESWDALCVSDEETLATIASTHRSNGLIVDPHTAVGLSAAHRCRRFGDVPMVTLATAHPAKFPEAIVEAIGVHPEIPDRLAAVSALPEHFEVLPADFAIVTRHVRHRVAPIS